MPETSSLPTAALAHRAVQFLLERKVNDVVMLGLAEVSDMTDYFIIASGTSDTHVRASAQHVIDEMKKVLDRGKHPYHQHAESAYFLARREGDVADGDAGVHVVHRVAPAAAGGDAAEAAEHVREG